jgi:uncharacterized protein
MDNPFGAAGTAKYVLATTFRRDGTPVATAVWAALDAGRLYVWTQTDSGKVKRLRRDPRLTLAPCSASGKPHGDVVEATGRVLDDAGTERVRRLIGARYGLIGRVMVKFSVLRRGRSGTVGIEISPKD